MNLIRQSECIVTHKGDEGSMRRIRHVTFTWAPVKIDGKWYSPFSAVDIDESTGKESWRDWKVEHIPEAQC